MVTQVKKASAFNPVETLRQHLTLKGEAATITTRADALKKRLKDFLPSSPDTYTNENGSVFYDLPETLVVKGQEYSGMELRRAVRVTFDEEVAESILSKTGVLQEALSTFIDQDKVRALQQQGKITEKDIDKMMPEAESWAFWPVKGEVL